MTPSLGVCYYPEHWPEERWADDAGRMAEAGLTWVRIGEFAWSRMEPAPGKLDFAWLDRAIDTLGAAGLKVVLGTPTATPPRWMLDRHPDMLALDREGRPRGFGSRRHYCFSHPGYREECRRIATLLGERYGRHPHVGAWQIDNEYSCHDTTLSYSEAARRGFRDWLARKYQSPQALNRAWGSVFWSMEYGDFDDIGLPNLTVTEPNPSHVMDFRRYSSEQVIAFNRVQTAALRPLTDSPLIHNYMGAVTDFDHYAVGEDLDVASWDSYPLGFLIDRVPEDCDGHRLAFARQGDPDFQAFHHDIYRAVGRGRLWVMEQQPGPVNWASWNPAPLPGMVRLWSWEAFAHGAEVVSYFRWRQAPFAQEQYHAGLLRPDSADAPALAEVRQVADEIRDLLPQNARRAEVALVFDYESQWAWEVQPQGQDFSHIGAVFTFYRALRKLGLDIDILPPGDDPGGYRLILVPALMHLDPAWAKRLVESGATLLFGPRTNAKTPDMAIPVPLPPNLPGIAATVTLVESLPPGLSVPVSGGGSVIRWREEIETAETILLAAEDGRAVLAMSGRTAYLGGWPDRDLGTRVLTMLCDLAGIRTNPMPGALRQRCTATTRFLFNYGASEATFHGLTVPAAGVIRSPISD